MYYYCRSTRTKNACKEEEIGGKKRQLRCLTDKVLAVAEVQLDSLHPTAWWGGEEEGRKEVGEGGNCLLVA